MSQLQISYKPIDGANANIETQNGNNKVNTGEGVVRTDVLKTGTELKTDFYSINRAITESEQPLVRLEMDKALDVLNAIEKVCDEGTKTQLNLDQKTQHIGTVKNLFYKFLGLFSKSLENSKRTQALNAKLHSVAARLKDDKNLYNGVLLSTLNDPKLEALLKTTCFKLYDGDPETQDKLFKSLKEPPKEIREQFWERHGEKILNGSLMEKFFGIQTPVTKMSKAEWEACKGNPLMEMLCTELENNEKLTEKDITKDVIMDSFQTDADKKRFAKVYLKSVSNPTYLQDLFNQQAEESIHHMKNDTSDKEQAIAFFENCFNSDNFNENTAKKMANNQVFIDLARSVDAKVEFTFAGDRKFTITRQDCFDNSKEPPVKSFTAFCKNLATKQKALNLTPDEKHKLADFLALSPIQGYVAALKFHFVFEEHNVGANVSFSGGKTKVTVPFKFPVTPSLLTHYKYIHSFNNAFQSTKGEITGFLELEHKDIDHIKEVQHTTVKELKLSFEEP
jgi:hypothetical protein